MTWLLAARVPVIAVAWLRAPHPGAYRLHATRLGVTRDLEVYGQAFE